MSAFSYVPMSPDINTTNRTMKTGIVKPKTIVKRSFSASPTSLRPRGFLKKGINNKRYRSLSPSLLQDQNLEKPKDVLVRSSAPDKINVPDDSRSMEPEKEVSMPQEVITKSMRSLATKKREFLKIRKGVISQQNMLLEVYASMKEIELRTGVPDINLGDVRLVSITGWPAHDLLLLLRNDITSRLQEEINDGIASQVLGQLQGHLNSIPEEVRNINVELIARRNEVLQLMRSKQRGDRFTYTVNKSAIAEHLLESGPNHWIELRNPKILSTERHYYNRMNLDWKLKNSDLDSQTEKLNKMTAKLTNSIKMKIKEVFGLAKMSWIDREALAKKVERLQIENTILQHKIDEALKRNSEGSNEGAIVDDKSKALSEQLTKERSEKEALKEVISAAESMLRVARTRIGMLERQIKEVKCELETTRRKHKELEQLYRHREMNFDTRSKKLIELSKTGEITIETLSRQRDALELRVKELCEQATMAEKTISQREADLQARTVTVHAKVAEKEKEKAEAESRVVQLQTRVKALEEQLSTIQEQCARLVEIEKQHCLKYLPAKEMEPSNRETEIWKELQITRAALVKMEDELRQSRADKDNFLNSLSRIAQAEGDKDDKMATELLDREQKISRLQSIIEEQRENEKVMEQSMANYENQLVDLRLEVKRLRNYDCYFRDTPYQDLKTELLEMQMQVAKLNRERAALVTAAASRALILERHERAAELFAKITRARRELAAQLDGSSSRTHKENGLEVSRSLSSLCASAADTWSALQTERARVLQLESAIIEQSMHLDRADCVRTQLERRRAVLEREILSHELPSSESSLLHPNFMI